MKSINDIIRERFPHEPTKKIAEDLGLTYSQVSNRAYTMKIHKTQEYMNSLESGRFASGSMIGKATQFKKGRVPHNKGKKMNRKVYDKLSKTMFKKKNIPHNQKPDASLVERTDKTGRVYLYYKVSDRNWIPYHRKIWEDHHGSIPQGYIIKFIDGNTKNCAIENLMISSKADNIRQNSIHRWPEFLQQIIRLKQKLTKKIKNHGKK